LRLSSAVLKLEKEEEAREIAGTEVMEEEQIRGKGREPGMAHSVCEDGENSLII
jgi:hypothetical protein